MNALGCSTVWPREIRHGEQSNRGGQSDRRRSTPRIQAADLRDAAHEACHALESDLRGKWTRDRIHTKLTRGVFSRMFLVESEIKARAVEQIVCKRLGVETDPVDSWAAVALLEMATTFGNAPPLDLFLATVAKRMASPTVIALAGRVIALGAA